ncbi:MAG: signal peptidase II [Actinomycetota bacterium]
MTRLGRSVAGALFAVAGVVWVLDRLSKLWVEHTLAGRPPITLIPGVLDLRFTTNPGGAFSLGQRSPWIFVGASILVSVAIVATAFRHTNVATSLALGLILGGAVGNLTDRIVRGPGFSGHVVDFVDFQVWPVFNLADAAIVVGAVVLAISSFAADRDREPSHDAG